MGSSWKLPVCHVIFSSGSLPSLNLLPDLLRILKINPSIQSFIVISIIIIAIIIIEFR